MIFFHGTCKKAALKIQKQGLIPRKGKGADAWAANNTIFLGIAMQGRANHAPEREAVYLTTRLDIALWFADMAADLNRSEPAIFQVHVPDDFNMAYDEAWDGSPEAQTYPGTIDPQYLRLMEPAEFKSIPHKPLPGVFA